MTPASGTAPRHVLVVASQCPAEGPLKQLEAAARELHAVLVDPLLGDCRAREGESPSLLTGRELTPNQVTDAIKEAARRAADEHGVLVLALLGHGFTKPRLHYMVTGSTRSDPTSAVDVPSILAAVANIQGLAGLIALIDTCEAAGGVPSTESLVAGTREGLIGIKVLAAAAAGQSAWNMSFSFALAQVIREGLTDAGSKLQIDDTLMGRLRALLRGQDIGCNVHEQRSRPPEPLWLAHNQRHDSGGTRGTLGRTQLAEAAACWPGAPTLPVEWTAKALIDFKARLADCEAAEDGREVAARLRLAQITEGLLDCARTETFLNECLYTALSDETLRAAGRLTGLPPKLLTAPVLGDMLEHTVLSGQSVDTPRFHGLARLVAALAHLANQDLTGPLLSWAQKHHVVQQLRSAMDEFARAEHTAGVRLVLGLDDAFGDWPEEVQCWLVRDGTTVQSSVFPCSTADAHGVGQAMRSALMWARSLLHESERPLEYVDVAASAQILARWHPEEAVVGRRLLGIDHKVTVRWGGALYPDVAAGDDTSEINDASSRLIQKIERCPGDDSVRWLGTPELEDLGILQKKLMTTPTDSALGMTSRPSACRETLEVLLPYAPILVWPAEGAALAEERVRHVVREHWHALPDGFADAHRQRLDPEKNKSNELGEVRAVWHDRRWLAFCRQFEDRVVTVPEEES